MNKLKTMALWALLLGWAAWLAPALAVAQMTGLPGDVNLDGVINVLDVQTSVNMALGQATANPEADVDLNTTVDVLDVQTITNTALGAGGLLQRVSGVVSPLTESGAAGALTVIAVSIDGRIVTAPVDAVTGAFELLLDVRTAWSIAIEDSTTGTFAGTIVFPLGDGGLSSTLPLPNLSRGDVLELGVFPVGVGQPAASDVRALVGQTADPVPLEDNDGNGASDVLEELLLPLPLPTSGPLGNLSALLDGTELVRRLDFCLDGQGIDSFAPDLTGAETGIPDVVRPIFDCLDDLVVDWMLDELDVPSFLRGTVAEVADDLVQTFISELEDVLAELDVPELEDTNGNSIPDFIESELCLYDLPAAFGDNGLCLLDGDGNGLPDFADDSDSNGIANLLDDQVVIEGDRDRDGVPDAADVDADNNGIPDYAESNR
ncbi:MAG: hypothetical protein GC168_14375 [Candidatus Hydrogenedens sp.]|nr:hypothetical protein [Candidatus Hydrogenedens sp.]